MAGRNAEGHSPKFWRRRQIARDSAPENASTSLVAGIAAERSGPEPWREFVFHVVPATLLGALVSYSGPREALVRFFGLAMLFLWMAYDAKRLFWARHDGSRRWLIVGGLIAGCAVVFGGLAYLSYLSEVGEQLRAIDAELIVSKDHQSIPNDPFSTTFNIANHSAFRILASSISCIPSIKFAKGGGFWGNRLHDDSVRTYDSPLPPGEEETYVCDPGQLPDMLCADLEIAIRYRSEIRPQEVEHKSVRFLSRREVDGVHFYRESASNPSSLCFP